MRRTWTLLGLAALAVALAAPAAGDAACCYFSAKNADILQPAQKVFITWDPVKKTETFTVQPKFEGNAQDFGMVIPTPAQPKLNEMPRDFFKELAVLTILKKREQPHSNLLPILYPPPAPPGAGGAPVANTTATGGGAPPRKPAVVVLEAGVVGSLDYKVIKAERADDLFKWLKDNKYSYAGDEGTLNHYVQKKWICTVMKIDTMQMKKNKDGSDAGEVTPTRFKFSSEKLVYPLKITQISVKDKTEALFYVQAPFKVDLQGDMTYQYQWVPMLQTARSSKKKTIPGAPPQDLPGGGGGWLDAIDAQLPQLLQRGQALGFNFVARKRPQPTPPGRTPTTMEWARRLTATAIKMLC